MEGKNRHQITYRARHITTIYVDLNQRTDADILQWLEGIGKGHKMRAIKEACRKAQPRRPELLDNEVRCPWCLIPYTPVDPDIYVSFCPYCGQAIYTRVCTPVQDAEQAPGEYTPVQDTEGCTPVQDAEQEPGECTPVQTNDKKYIISYVTYSPNGTPIPHAVTAYGKNNHKVRQDWKAAYEKTNMEEPHKITVRLCKEE